MNITPKNFPDILKTWNTMDVKEAIDLIESELGIRAVSSIQIPEQPVIEEPVEEQIEFDVVLEKIGNQKIEVIKVVRAISGLGLKESKELVDSATDGSVKLLQKTTRATAEDMVFRLKSAGATASIT